MHRHAAEQADLFMQNLHNPDVRVDSQLTKHQVQQTEENKVILRQDVLAVEFLAKQGLAFRGDRNDKVDFVCADVNRGNFIATLQLLGKENSVLQKHLLLAKSNAKYASKIIQNEIIHIYACKIRERSTKQMGENVLPFTVIADEVTDPHANQEILSVCVRSVDLPSPRDPHIRAWLFSLLYLERANASTICISILESLSDTSVSLDPSNIRGQAYDGAAVMSSSRAGVQAKIKETAPLAMYTLCYAHCLNLSVSATCIIPEVTNLIGVINEVSVFSQKYQEAGAV